MAHSVFSHPELSRLIADQVNDRRDLRRLVRVSQRFNTIFSPDLWRVMDIRNFDKWPNKIWGYTYSPLTSRNMAHIRSIKINLPRKPNNKNWRKLRKYMESACDFLERLILHCPRMESFDLQWGPFDRSVMKALALLPRLSDLRLHFRSEVFFPGTACGSGILPCSGQLRRLEISGLPLHHDDMLTNDQLQQWEVGIAAALRGNPQLEYLTISLNTDEIHKEYRRHNGSRSPAQLFLRDICHEYHGNSMDDYPPLANLRWVNVRKGIKLPRPETLALLVDLSALQGLYLYNDVYHPKENRAEPTPGWVSWDTLSYDNMPNLRYLFFSAINMDVWQGLPELVQTRIRSAGNSAPGIIGVGAHSFSGDMLKPHWSSNWSADLPAFLQFPAMLENIPMLSFPPILPKEAAETPEMRFEHIKDCTWLTHFYCPFDGHEDVAVWFPKFLEVLASLKNLQALWMPFPTKYQLKPYLDSYFVQSLDSNQGSGGNKLPDAKAISVEEKSKSEHITQDDLREEYYDTAIKSMVLRMAKANPLLTYISLGMAGTWKILRVRGAATGEGDVRLITLDITENREHMPHFFHLSETIGCEESEALVDGNPNPLAMISNKIPFLFNRG